MESIRAQYFALILEQAITVYFTVTRPDISYAVHQVSQYLFAPRSIHYVVVLHILLYLKSTFFHSFFYFAQSPFVLCAFSNAD